MDAKSGCGSRGFHVPQNAADGSVIFCRDCGAGIWVGATPYESPPSNEAIWEMARLAKESN